MTVFDRSWYGRLLVERVESEINADGDREAFRPKRSSSLNAC
jgi:polyphosphate kinase 2 (PPK2 family)